MKPIQEATRASLLDKKDELNRLYWKLEEEYKGFFKKKRELCAKLIAIGRKRADVSNKILDIIQECRRREKVRMQKELRNHLIPKKLSQKKVLRKFLIFHHKNKRG